MRTTNKTRRRLISVLSTGSGVIAGSTMLPDIWTKPVVDAVLLPAHAQLSEPPEEETPLTVGCAQQTSTVVQDGGPLLAVVTIIPAPTTDVEAVVFCDGAAVPSVLPSGIPLVSFVGTDALVAVPAPTSSGSQMCPAGGTWELRVAHPQDGNIMDSCTWDVLEPAGP